MSRTKEDIANEIEVSRQKLSDLETTYEAEEDEGKAQKLEYKIDRMDGRINVLLTRLDGMPDEDEEEEGEEEDEDCCPNCGGDLTFVGVDKDTGNNIFECDLCHGWYEEE